MEIGEKISGMLSRMRFPRAAFSAFCIVVLCAPLVASAADLAVTPAFIDEKAKPRDIIKQSITLVNTSERKLNLFPSVRDVDRDEGEKEFARAQNSAEREASLANWIELSRGVIELSPGEEKTVPFVIRVNLNALEGAYHANIAFYEGSSREAAESNPPTASIDVNVEVSPDVKEILQLNSFFTDNIFFSGDDVAFNYQFENVGNQNLQPKGEIRIYDRRGKEVAAVGVNPDGKMVGPDEISQLASVWTAAEGFGRYKAFLNVDFGASQTASVQDTVYFWIVPWQQLVGMVVAMLIAVIFLALYFHKWFDRRYHAKYAHAAAQVGVTIAADNEEKMPGFFVRMLAKIPRPRLPRRTIRAEVPMPIAEKREKPLLREALATSIPKVEPAPAPQHQNVVPVSAPTPAPAPVRVGGGHTIDLKQTHQQSAQAPKAHHVINLKNPQ